MARRTGNMIRILTAVAVLSITAAAYAHHSFPAYYFEEQTVTIEGTVVEFDYRAPHAWLYVHAPDTDGQMQKFSAEWANPSRWSSTYPSRISSVIQVPS